MSLFVCSVSTWSPICNLIVKEGPGDVPCASMFCIKVSFLQLGVTSIKCNPHFVPVRSKTALLEGLEVDQYMLGILVYIQK